MSQTKLIPGEALIYESANGVTYARYRDPPHNQIPRWVVGGHPDAVSRASGNLFSWSEWQEMNELAKTNETLKRQIDNLLNTYYLVKNSEKK